jgi:hypothetical protein
MEHPVLVANLTYKGLTYLGEKVVCDYLPPGISPFVSGQQESSVPYHRRPEQVYANVKDR